MTNLLHRYLLKRPPRKTDADYHQVLEIYSTYYRQLNDDLQQQFRFRLYVLLITVTFLPNNLPLVTQEMRVVIGSAIIQITFGFKHYLPERFDNVIVLPRRYMYPGYGQPFLGHTDIKKRTIYFSWEDVRHGYLVPDDAINVALHEMAHLLEHEHAYTMLYSRFFDLVSWKKWGKLAFDKMEMIRANQHDFLKSYGGVNMSEMFAVCVETFFEQPTEFKEQLPELYKTMTELLRQDPLLAANPVSWNTSS